MAAERTGRDRPEGRTMKGVIFNVVEEAVVAEHSPETWDRILERAGLAGAYTSLGSYPDAELLRIVAVAGDLLETNPDELLRWAGRKAFAGLGGRHPEFARTHIRLRSFLHSVNQVIHPEVRKLYPHSVVPEFDTTELADGTIRMVYRSPRRLCALAHGLMLGAADHYGEQLAVEQIRCVHRGDEACEFVLSIGRPDGV